MTVLVTLVYHGQAPRTERQDIKSYDMVRCVEVLDSGFLRIQTDEGDFSFDPKLWRSFVVSRPEEIFSDDH